MIYIFLLYTQASLLEKGTATVESLVQLERGGEGSVIHFFLRGDATKSYTQRL